MSDYHQQPDKESCYPDPALNVEPQDCSSEPFYPCMHPFGGPGGAFRGRPHHHFGHPFAPPPGPFFPPQSGPAPHFRFRGSCGRGTGNRGLGGRGSGDLCDNRGQCRQRRLESVDFEAPHLYYSDSVGLAEQIRLCFVLGNVKFVDKRMSSEEWATKYKQISPSGTMPFLLVGNTCLSQSRALLLYAARRGNLIPNNSFHQMQSLTMAGLLGDSLTESIRGLKGTTEKEQQASFVQQIMKHAVPNHWVRLNAMIIAGQTEESYAVGNHYTYVDAAIAGTLYALFTLVKDTPVEAEFSELVRLKLPAWKKIMDSVYGDSRVQEFLRKRIIKPTISYREGCWRAAVLMKYMDVYSLRYEPQIITDETWNKDTTPILPWMASPHSFAGGLHACFEWIEEWLTNRDLQGSLSLMKTAEETARFRGYMEQITNLMTALGDGTVADPEAFMKDLEMLNRLVASTQHRMGFVMSTALTFVDVMVAVLYERLMTFKHNLTIVPNSLKNLKHSAEVCTEHASIKAAKLSRLPTPRLVYFDSPFYVEGCRLMFHASQKQFEDVHVSMEDWVASQKAESVTGHVPFLEIGGNRFYEGLVVNEMVGDITGYEAQTYKGRYAAKQIAAFYIMSVMPVYKRGLGLPSEQREEFWQTHLTPAHDKLERLILEHQTHEDHAVQNSFTWIDFFLAGAYEWAKLTKVETAETGTPKWPSWKKIRDAVYAIPEVQEYVSSVQARARFDPFTPAVLQLTSY